MSFSTREVIRILQLLRNSRTGEVSIATLLSEYDGHIPDHTGAGIFGDALIQLARLGFISVKVKRREKTSATEPDADITNEIWPDGHPVRGHSLADGYELADRLRGSEKTTFLCLGRMLADLQEVLGLSLSELAEDQRGSSIRVRPIFGARWPSRDENATDVFVLMPFDPQFAPVFQDHILKICTDLCLDCKRADNIFGSADIISDVWALINNSKLLIADCTTRNPNVFYELGIAHTLGKNVIIITQNTDDIPFDIRHIRYIKYDFTPRGMIEFEETLKKYVVASVEPQAHGNVAKR